MCCYFGCLFCSAVLALQHGHSSAQVHCDTQRGIEPLRRLHAPDGDTHNNLLSNLTTELKAYHRSDLRKGTRYVKRPAKR